MSSIPAQVESNIIAACREHQAQHGRIRAGCVVVEQYFVKYGDPASLDCDVKTRAFLSSTEPHPNKPRIPKLVHHFDNGQGTAYVVLERVKLAESPVDLAERIAAVVTWLSGLQAPPDHRLGPLGGGCIRHAFFESKEAPLPFVSVKAHGRYVEKGRKRLYGSGRGYDPVSLTDERLVCVQGNLNEGHRLLRAIHTLVKDKRPTIADSLALSGETNMQAMVAIAHNLGMTADPTLGLDNYGKTANKETTGTTSVDA